MKGTKILKKTFTEEEFAKMKEIADGKDYLDFESFKEDLLKNIRELQNLIAAERFYSKIRKRISSLQYFPEMYP